MGLRCLLCLMAVEAFLLRGSLATTSPRQRRQTSDGDLLSMSPIPESDGYRPPIALAVPQKNSYRPPISLVRSDEYRSPLMQQRQPPPPPNPQPADAPRTYNSHPQTYVLQNHHHHHQPQSVQYFPPVHQQQSLSVLQQPALQQQQQHPFPPQPATSYSVHQQPVHHQHQAQPASFSQSTTAERTSKVVASHVASQAIHKAPASEIARSDKGQAAKEKDKGNDEYVVYYYYYYDNDTAANNSPNNLSLNFDDIPSLESYDGDGHRQASAAVGESPERGTVGRNLPVVEVNSLSATDTTGTSSSQPRSVGGDEYGRPGNAAPVQPLKPVSNVFRYGSNEVPRFPVLPNFVVTEVPTTTRPDFSTPDTLTTEPPATQPSSPGGNAVQPDLKTGDEADDDDLNSVLDNASRPKAVDDKLEEDHTTTTAATTTTATEPPTTTEEATTTEKPRRRPSLGGGSRRRFNPSPSSSSSFSPSRNRQTSGRSSTSSTTSTTTTTTSTPPRRSFQGNRIRPRPPVGGNRPRSGSRTTETTNDEGLNEERAVPYSESAASSGTTASATRSRFTSAVPRRFQSSRSRTASSSAASSTSTTRTPSSAISRSRPPTSSRPRPNLISRNRPPRPGFLRPRPGSEPEEAETTTAAAAPAASTSEQGTPSEASEDETASTHLDDDDESNETEEDNETSVEETEEPATTEGSRFSALFRPRNRNLGNRPRPVIGNRPPRS